MLLRRRKINWLKVWKISIAKDEAEIFKLKTGTCHKRPNSRKNSIIPSVNRNSA